MTRAVRHLPLTVAGLVLAIGVVAAPGLAASEASGGNGGDVAPLASSLSLALEAVPASAEDGIALQVRTRNGGIALEGGFSVSASPGIVWSVLTDYDGIGRFVSSMRESHVTRRASDSVFVEQEAVGRMFLFSRRLHARLRIHEEPPARIRFEDVLGKDFRHYRGEWSIGSAGSGATVIYRLEADPAFSIPDFVARSAFRGAARDLLKQVRAEIERRAALASR